MMVGSSTAWICSTVRTPRLSISSTTRSLWTTCPRMAPRPPPEAKRFTFRSAMRTPEQKPYFAARFTFIDRTERIEQRKHSEKWLLSCWVAELVGDDLVSSYLQEPSDLANQATALKEPLLTPRFAGLW